MIPLWYLYLVNSLNITLFILLLLVIEPILKKHFSAICLYRMWIVLLIGLLVPVRIQVIEPAIWLGLARMSEPNETSQSADTIILRNTGTTGLLTQAKPDRNVNYDKENDPIDSEALQKHSAFLSILISNSELILITIWAIGVALVLFINANTYYRYKRYLKRMLTPANQRALPEKCRHLFNNRSAGRVKLYNCSAITSPVSIGIAKQVILLPEKEYESKELYFLLRHELIHIRRRDSMIKLLRLVVMSVNWFNPFVYVLSQHLDHWCELSCDELVLAKSAKSDCMDYCKLLLKCADTQKHQNTSLAMNFYGGKMHMKDRLGFIMNRYPKSSGKIILLLFVVIVSTTAMVSGCSKKSNIPDNNKVTSQSSEGNAVTAVPAKENEAAAAKGKDNTGKEVPAEENAATVAPTKDNIAAEVPDETKAATTKPKENNATAAPAPENSNSITKASRAATYTTPRLEAKADSREGAISSRKADGNTLQPALAKENEQEKKNKAAIKLERGKDNNLKKLTAAEQRDKVAAFAKEAEGAPYLWGGSDLKKGVDSSGFVQAIYKEFGYELPRTSRAQKKACDKVSLDELLPGDLIFYTMRDGTVNHVGIYLGNNHVIHATNMRDGVKISDYNYRTPDSAGRVIAE